jgi:hypothetical protein
VRTGGIPRAEYDAAVGRVVLDLADALPQLVDALPRVVLIAVRVLRAKVAPLETVHGPQIALAAMAQAARLEERGRAVAVPDLDALGGEEGRVCRAADEPEQLLDDAAQEGALGGEEGEGVVCQGKTQGRGREEGEGAGAGAVGSRRAGVEDASDEIQVLLLFVYSGHGRRKKNSF